MCGICGYFSTQTGRMDLQSQLARMTRSLRRRGPDGEGLWFDEELTLGFGHRRLSVIDLSSAAGQPMFSGNGRYILTFNGEIYNYVELKKELAVLGVVFKTSSDTEVLLEAICMWGLKETLLKVRGMLALALFDKNSRRLYLARDRFGEKPLYYTFNENVLAFSSELKSFKYLKDIALNPNEGAIAGYFRYNFVPGLQTVFKDIYKVENGTILTFELDKDFVRFVCCEKYFCVVQEWQRRGYFSGSLRDAQDQLEELLKIVVNEQRRSDVEVGCFLSSGVDSTLLAALLQQQNERPIKTFNIAFADDEFDESDGAAFFARQIGSDHHRVVFSDNDVVRLLPECVSAFSEPFADTSQLPMLLLCQYSKEKVKVCLSGDGADELFGGYVRHRQIPMLQKQFARFEGFCLELAGRSLVRIPLNRLRAIEKVLRHASVGLDVPRHFATKLHKLGWAMLNSPEIYDSLLAEWHHGDLPVKAVALRPDFLEVDKAGPFHSVLLNDLNIYLRDDILVKTDSSAMCYGLETRLPYLDKRVFEFALSLPEKYLLNMGKQKIILNSLRDKLLPGKWQFQAKSGFSPPLRRLLKGRLRDWAESLIFAPILENHGVDLDVVRKKWQEFQQQKYDWTFSIWALMIFSSWLEKSAIISKE